MHQLLVHCIVGLIVLVLYFTSGNAIPMAVYVSLCTFLHILLYICEFFLSKDTGRKT